MESIRSPGSAGDLFRPRAGHAEQLAHLIPRAPLVKVPGDLSLDFPEGLVESNLDSEANRRLVLDYLATIGQRH